MTADLIDQEEIKREYRKQYWAKNREKLLEYHRQYRLKHLDTRRAFMREYSRNHRDEKRPYLKEYNIKHRDRLREQRREHRVKNILKILVRDAGERAKKKGWDFDITVDDLKMPTYCEDLGRKLVVGTEYVKDNSPSLDRIDSSRGYVKGNVRIISHLANRIKCNATDDDLIKMGLAAARRKKLLLKKKSNEIGTLL